MILLALSGYKNYAPGDLLGGYIYRGIKSRLKSIDIIIDSMADGGEGTLKKLVNFNNGRTRNLTGFNALGEPVKVQVGEFIKNKKKYIIFETFQTAGFGYSRPKKFNTLHTSSYGTGSALRKILNKKPDILVIGLGGSIVSDGGLGLGSALGLKYLDNKGKIVLPTKINFSCLDLLRIKKIKLNKKKLIKNTKIVILSDANIDLIGNNGQAKTFGPQKGATIKEINFIENSLMHWNNLLKETYSKDFNIPYAGASGGMGAGISAILNGKIHSGAEYILKNTKLKKRIKHSKYIVLGEGTIDKSTLLNKGILALAKESKKQGKIVFGVFGSIKCKKNLIDQYFDHIINVSSLASKNNLSKDYFKKKKGYLLFEKVGNYIANKIMIYEKNL